VILRSNGDYLSYNVFDKLAGWPLLQEYYRKLEDMQKEQESNPEEEDPWLDYEPEEEDVNMEPRGLGFPSST
jgi:hypothetical protein